MLAPAVTLIDLVVGLSETGAASGTVGLASAAAVEDRVDGL